jgi:hypothetical protein
LCGNNLLKRATMREKQLKKAYLDWKVTDKDGKVQSDGKLESTPTGKVQKNRLFSSGKLIMTVYKNGQLVHIHCKDAACMNEWKIKDSPNWNAKFDVQGPIITCKKCGRAYNPG